MSGKQHHVITSIPQRREFDVDYAKAIEQFAAKWIPFRHAPHMILNAQPLHSFEPVLEPGTRENAGRGRDGARWYRCVIRVPDSWLGDDELTVKVNPHDNVTGAWFNGAELDGIPRFTVPQEWIQKNDKVSFCGCSPSPTTLRVGL